MAYIGKAPINGFHAKQSLTGDGSTVTFTLDQTVATETALIVSVGGVIQEPSEAYNLAIGGTKITFTEAPSSTDTVYIQFLGTAIVQNLLDVNGAEFILDLNGNTSFTADTDDEIDIKVGGSDRSTIKATGFHNLDNIKFVAGTGDDMQMYHDGTNSYLTNSEGALKIATETSSIAVTIGHTTSEVTIADNATVAGNLTVTGTLTQTGSQTFDGGIDVDNFNINGTTIALSSGDMTLDSAGDIILDADGGDVFFKDAGTTFGSATNTSGNLIIKSGTTTALTFAGANATLAGTLGVGAVTSTGIVTGTAFTAGSAVLAEAELELLDGLTAGTAIASKVVTTDANIDTTGQRNLTISGELDAATGDFSGDVDIDGTLEADAITVNGTALASVIAGTTVNLATLASTVTITDNESTDENNAIIFTAGGDVDGGSLGLESDGDLTYNPSSGTLNVPNISVTGTQTIVNSVTMNASNAVIFEGATADAHETTLTTIDATGDRTISLPNVSGTLPVLAAASATAITSTPEELNLLDGITAGTVLASKALVVDSNKALNELTVDDVAINGKVITMTGSSGDTFVTTVAANGATSLVTVDAAAAAAHLQITADGTVDIDSAGVLTLDSGAAINIEPASGSAILLDGTISIDAGVVTGATSITSTAFVGALTGAASSNLLKAGGTMTGDLVLGDNVSLEIGSGTNGDLQIHHDGSHTHIDNKVGDLRISTTTFKLFNLAADESMIQATQNDAVDLYFNNSKKFETTNIGVTVTGTIIATTDTDTSNTGNVTLDFAANQNFVLTLTGNTTLVNPSTEQVGQSGFIAFIQDGTGGRTITLGTDYETAGGVGITLTSAASKTDLVPYVVVAAGRILLGQPQRNFS